MGVYRVRMPQLGETVEEGTVVSWRVEPGTSVSAGDVLLEISTDKVDTDIESTVDGVFREALVPEGETVPVGAVLAEIEVEGAGEPDEAPEEKAAASTSAPAATEPQRQELRGTDLLLSPVVRRLVDEHGIDLDALAAFATSPRVNRKVVEDFIAQRGPGAPETDAAPAAGNLVPFTRIRKVTAERMVASKQTSAHVVTAVEVDFEAIAALRAAHRERSGSSITWLPLVACAVARTLGDFGHLNASVQDGDGLILHPDVHLGIAVDLDGEGLVVPVIRDAAQLDLSAMAERIREAAGHARSRSLTPDDLTGGTFTITGQGPHGTLFTAPIINQPQVAILSVDGIRKRPVVLETERGDEIVAHHTGVLALSWDHRAVDGVYAARFLERLRVAIEGSDWAGELT